MCSLVSASTPSSASASCVACSPISRPSWRWSKSGPWLWPSSGPGLSSMIVLSLLILYLAGQPSFRKQEGKVLPWRLAVKVYSIFKTLLNKKKKIYLVEKNVRNGWLDYHNIKFSTLDGLEWQEKSYNKMFKFYIFFHFCCSSKFYLIKRKIYLVKKGRQWSIFIIKFKF